MAIDLLASVNSSGFPAPALALVAFVLVFLWRHRDTAVGASRRPDLPQSWKSRSLPLIGDSLTTLAYSPRLLEHALDTLERVGPVSTFSLPWQRMIFVLRPEWIQHAQKDAFPAFEKGWIQRNVMKDVLGQGIFATDGHIWHTQRKNTSRIFNAKSFRGIIADSIEGHMSTLINVLSKKADVGEDVEMSTIYFRYTLDTFVRLCFGIELDCVKSDQNIPFADAFDFLQCRMDRRALTPGWWILEPFTATGRRVREAKKVVDDFCYSIIDERDRRDVSGQGDKGTTDLLSLYRNIRDDKGQPMNRKELRDAVLNLIIAGRDTTAQALSWLTASVCYRPELLDPVREEAKKLLPNGEAVNYDNFRSLVQANALFHEVLRLHPSVPKNVKVCNQDEQFPHGGPFVRKGEIIVWSDWVMARDPAVWGKDAKELKPSRWINEDGSFRAYDQWQAHMFNGGQRLCLGQTLATYEAVAVIVALARNFDFSWAPGATETMEVTGDIVDTGMKLPLYGNSLTLPPKEPMRMRLTRRTAA